MRGDDDIEFIWEESVSKKPVSPASPDFLLPKCLTFVVSQLIPSLGTVAGGARCWDGHGTWGAWSYSQVPEGCET